MLIFAIGRTTKNLSKFSQPSFKTGSHAAFDFLINLLHNIFNTNYNVFSPNGFCGLQLNAARADRQSYSALKFQSEHMLSWNHN